MPFSKELLSLLRSGRPVAAELAASRPNMRAYVIVIPKVPGPHKRPGAWREWGDKTSGLVLVLKKSSDIAGYEIRYIEHDAKYTHSEWGWDYDRVLDDASTRIKRVFAERKEQIEQVINLWLQDVSQLRPTRGFDSSLVDSPIDAYLDRPEERPHLWLD